MKQPIRRVFVAEKKVEVTIVVEISPCGTEGLKCGFRQTSLAGHVGEGAVPIVSQQRISDRQFPRPAHHEEVEETIIVIVGLYDVQSTELVGKPGLRSPVGEGSVAIVVEIAQRRTRIEAGGN